jgi:hypothetical protein
VQWQIVVFIVGHPWVLNHGSDIVGEAYDLLQIMKLFTVYAIYNAHCCAPHVTGV